ncbi:hypothetical protein D915_002334 [Fasciola hepatica]|uniref:Uncharacterized protein n=1 Tax=Fasciola hepatica TaxID=6192 RepID=A0A2H1CMP8_FASHE|nr:hypothetical protein D915_002334 [Fasciola hepatica]
MSKAVCSGIMDENEVLRRLRLLHRYANDPDMLKLVKTTERWRKAAREALMELVDIIGGGITEFELLSRYGIEPDSIGLETTAMNSRISR